MDTIMIYIHISRNSEFTIALMQFICIIVVVDKQFALIYGVFPLIWSYAVVNKASCLDTKTISIKIQIRASQPSSSFVSFARIYRT